MASVHLETIVDAPRERVFDLARDVDAHVESMDHHDERAVDGVTDGLLEAGDEVTWRATHLGLPLELTVAITEMDAPTYFRDEQVDGPFAWMEHDHRFEALGEDRTRMVDDFRFASPMGPLGRIVDALVLRRYMRRLLRRRNRSLRRMAEDRE